MIYNSDFWGTPDEVVRGIAKYCYDMNLTTKPFVSIDVCASDHNTKVKGNYITQEMNALESYWGFDDLAWCNPPYSRGNVDRFVLEAVKQYQMVGTETIMLLNVDVSTEWFTNVVKYAKAIIYVTHGRIKFLDPETGIESKRPSKANMFVVFGNRIDDKLISLYLPKHELYQLGV